MAGVASACRAAELGVCFAAPGHGRGPRAPTASGLACCSRSSAEIMLQPQGFRTHTLTPHDVLQCSCVPHESGTSARPYQRQGLYELIGLSEYVIFPRPPQHWGAATAGAPQYWRSAETEPARFHFFASSENHMKSTLSYGLEYRNRKAFEAIGY